MNNQLIIFSKNRACQLELLLNSISTNASALFDKITILYKADSSFNDAYEILISNWGEVNFVREHDFKHDLISLVSNDYIFTTFLVDDAVIYEKISSTKDEILTPINSNDVVCFSLRLGKNCNYSHPANLNYTLAEHSEENEFLKFNFKQQAGDFSYPLSTDGHIFRTSFILPLLVKTPFNNPNTLEANLQTYLFLNIPRIMYCHKHSKVVSIPVNLVNNTFKNRHGLEHYMSETDLNTKFMNGETIDLTSMDFSNVNGPHKEIEYKFKSKNV